MSAGPDLLCGRPGGCDMPARVMLVMPGFDTMRLCLTCATDELAALADLASTGCSHTVQLSPVVAS